MDGPRVQLDPAPIGDMPSDALTRAYRLMSTHLAEVLAAGGGEEIAALRRDCETFGVELLRRELI